MDVEVKAMALNVVIPEELRWTDVRRGTYVSFPVRDVPGIRELMDVAALRGGELWAQHRGWEA